MNRKGRTDVLMGKIFHEFPCITIPERMGGRRDYSISAKSACLRNFALANLKTSFLEATLTFALSPSPKHPQNSSKKYPLPRFCLPLGNIPQKSLRAYLFPVPVIPQCSFKNCLRPLPCPRGARNKGDSAGAIPRLAALVHY